MDISIRDQKRIYSFCNQLAEIWASNVPDWRFGQLVMNVLGEMQDDGLNPFFQEEKEMMEYFHNFFSK